MLYLVLRRLTTPLAIVFLMLVGGVATKAQWQRIPLPGSFDLELYLDVFFLPDDARFGWACSQTGAVIRTVDGGTTWSGVMIADTNVFLEYIQFFDRFSGYTCGPSGIFRTNDGGLSWTNVTPSGVSSLNSPWGAYFLDRNRGVYLAGGCAGQVQQFYYTTNGGVTWTLEVYNEGESGLTDALLFGNGRGLAVSSGKLWRSFDDGRTWEVFASTPINAWHEELSYRNGIVLLPSAGNRCGGEGEGIGAIMWGETTDGPWRVFQTGRQMYGTFLVSETEGWGVGTNGAVFQTRDAGRTWRLKDCGINGASLDDIFFVNDTLGFIAGQGMFRSNFNAVSKKVTVGPTSDTLVCPEDPFLVIADDGFVDYTWSTGETGRLISITQPGTYIVRATDPMTCVDSEDTIVVRHREVTSPVLLDGRESIEICPNDSILVSVTNDQFVSYAWNTGETSAAITVRSTGNYTVTVTDTAGCVTSATINITVRPIREVAIDVLGQTTFCSDDSVELRAPAGFSAYRWSNGSVESSIFVRTSGNYAVTVVDDIGCLTTTAEVAITVLNARNRISLAAAIVPTVVPDHEVGQRACVDITIRNLDTLNPLVIWTPRLAANVVFGLPPSQFPIVIPAEESRTLIVCAAATDSGAVADTLVFSDTCRPQRLPIVSYGKTIDFSGVDRCELPVDAVVYRAGTAHRLTAPFPNPTDQQARIQILAPRSSPLPRVQILDYTGSAVGHGFAEATVTDDVSTLTTVILDTRHLTPGMYAVTVTDAVGLRHSLPLHVVR
jgi:photosystem II stability/assembly factor-like uncharacterized protein